MADCGLPGDIIIEIMSRLPAKSLLRFRCVCKSWCSQIANPSFITKQLTQATHIADENLIIRCGGFGEREDVVFMLLSGKKTLDQSIKLKLPFVGRSRNVGIVGSCNGLLCVSLTRLGSRLYLWNPVTREYRKLPKPEITTTKSSMSYSVYFGFVFDVHSNDHKLVRLLCYKRQQQPPVYNAEVYSKKANSWKEINAILQCRVWESSHAVLGGGVHWIAHGTDYTGELIAYFDAVKEVFGEILLPEFFGSRASIGTGSKVATVNDLLAVVVHPLERYLNRCTDVWVMKEYGVKESWTKQFSIEPFPGVVRLLPKACCRSGKFVLGGKFVVECYKDKLFLYDINTQEFDKLPVRDARFIYDICTCMETLVSV